VRRLLVFLCALCVTGASSAGVVSPDTVDATGPQWLDDHTIEFEYAQNAYVQQWYVVRDDGSGFAPAPGPPPARDPQQPPVALGQFVTGASPEYGFDVSPDGSQVVFASWSGWVYQRGSVLYVADTDGVDVNVRRITPDVCTVSRFALTTGGRCLDGSDGPDRLAGTKHGDIVVAGPGDDIVRAGDGQNVVYGQWGNDSILTGSYVDTVYGGGGNDVIRTGAGEDYVYPGPGRDAVDAGREIGRASCRERV